MLADAVPFRIFFDENEAGADISKRARSRELFGKRSGTIVAKNDTKKEEGDWILRWRKIFLEEIAVFVCYLSEQFNDYFRIIDI